MLDNVRRTVADALRLLGSTEVGGGLPPARLARSLATALAERLYPPPAPRDWRPTAVAGNEAGSGWAGHATATDTGQEAGGLVQQVAEQARAAAGPHLELEAGELRSELDAGQEFLLVDVREPHETAQGIIPGAWLVPLGGLFARAAELGAAGRPVVCYCASGRRSQAAAQGLRERGIVRAYSLKGGLESWHSNGGDIARPDAVA